MTVEFAVATMALIFQLFGLFFALLGALNLLRPREMTSFAIRSRTSGNIEGHIEPSPVRLLFTRIMGGIIVIIGLGLAVGVLGP